MDDKTWLSAITGQAGAVVVLLLVVLSLVRWRYLVPGYAYAESLSRVASLEDERQEQNKAFVELRVHNAELQAEVRSLRSELEDLRGEVDRLRHREA